MNDEINKPSHYMIFPDMEAIDIIRKTLTEEEFKGYCKGNSLKYRLRAGEKGPAETCIAKAKVYEGWLYRASTKTLQEVISGLGAGRNFEQKPWYPDDSGEWVEVANRGDIPRAETVCLLTSSERKEKSYLNMKVYDSEVDNFFSYPEDPVVAYKKVNK